MLNFEGNVTVADAQSKGLCRLDIGSAYDLDTKTHRMVITAEVWETAEAMARGYVPSGSFYLRATGEWVKWSEMAPAEPIYCEPHGGCSGYFSRRNAQEIEARERLMQFIRAFAHVPTEVPKVAQL